MERKRRALFAAGALAIVILTQVPVGLASAARDPTASGIADPITPTWAPWIMIGLALLVIAAIRLVLQYAHRLKRAGGATHPASAIPEDWPLL